MNALSRRIGLLEQRRRDIVVRNGVNAAARAFAALSPADRAKASVAAHSAMTACNGRSVMVPAGMSARDFYFDMLDDAVRGGAQ